MIWIVSKSLVYYSMKWPLSYILECEFYVLEELDFCLLVFHPYRSLQPYLADLNMEGSLESVWSIVNDSYRTDISTCINFAFIIHFDSYQVSLMYPPHVIALACIFVSGIIAGKDVRPWFAELNVEMKDVWEVIKEILDAYDSWNGILFNLIFFVYLLFISLCPYYWCVVRNNSLFNNANSRKAKRKTSACYWNQIISNNIL